MAKASSYEIEKNFSDFLEKEGLSQERAKIDSILERYRDKPGSLIPVLQHIQQVIKYLPVPVQDYIAKGMNVPASYVYGVVTFYSFFTMEPRGDHVIRVCLGTACYVKGGRKIVENLEKSLKIKEGSTTPDKKFTLEVVRCLGACGLAPIMVVDDTTHGPMNPDKCIDTLKQYSDPGSAN